MFVTESGRKHTATLKTYPLQISVFSTEKTFYLFSILGGSQYFFSFKPCVILVLHSIFTAFAGTIQLTVSIFLHTSLQLSNEVWASLFLSRIWPTKVIRKVVRASFPGGILKKIRKNGKVNIFSSLKNSNKGTCTIIHLFPNFRSLDLRF